LIRTVRGDAGEGHAPARNRTRSDRYA
jgi:hypothetical protein